MRDNGDTALHEAVHACVAVALGRRVRWARVGERPIEGRIGLIQRGAVSIDHAGELDRRDLVISRAPGMYEGTPVAVDSGAPGHWHGPDFLAARTSKTAAHPH